MKKLLSVLLFLTVLVWFADPAYPAARTLTLEEYHATGDVRVVTGTATFNSGDTLAVGLNQILSVILTPRDNSNTRSGNPSIVHGISGSTVTVYTTQDGITLEVYIVGR